MSSKEQYEDLSSEWRVNLCQLLDEAVTNHGAAILAMPFNITKQILSLVAQRAIDLNDKELNKLMLRLSLYEISNPKSPHFDQEAVREYLDS